MTPARSSSSASGLTAVQQLETEADLDSKHRTGAGTVVESQQPAGVVDVEKGGMMSSKETLGDDDLYDDDDETDEDPYADVTPEQRGTAGLRRPWCVLPVAPSSRPRAPLVRSRVSGRRLTDRSSSPPRPARAGGRTSRSRPRSRRRRRQSPLTMPTCLPSSKPASSVRPARP